MSYATELIIKIKSFNPGRMASHPFIESNLRYMVFPMRDTFTIEIKSFNPGRMASHPFIESNLRYMVFPMRDTFTIENGLLD